MVLLPPHCPTRAKKPRRPRRRAAEPDPEGETGPLDSFRRVPKLPDLVRKFEEAVNEPTAFLRPNPDLSQLARSLTQALYVHASRQLRGAGSDSGATASAEALSQLHVDGFDAEQIWVQLELGGGGMLKRARRLLRKCGELSTLVTPQVEAAVDGILQDGAGGSSDDDGDDDVSGEDESEDGTSDDEDEEEHRRKRAKTGGKAPGSAAAPKRPGEDGFLSLGDMEAFLVDAEREAERRRRREEEEEDKEEEEDDEGGDEDEAAVMEELYGRGGGDGDGGDEEEDEMEQLLASSARLVGKKSKRTKATGGRSKRRGADVQEDDEDEDGEGAADVMYGDFFDPPAGRPARGGSGKASAATGGKRRRKAAEEEDDDHDEDADGLFDDGDDGDGAEEDEDESDDDDDELDGSDAEEEEEEEEDAGPLSGEEDVDEEEDEEEEEGRAGGRLRPSERKPQVAAAVPAQADASKLSTHELRLLRMSERIRELEQEALDDKHWTMVGEVGGTQRPLNSVLEVDLEYDNTQKPPPEPTEEVTLGVEDLIKKRIAEAKFDDVVRVAAPPVETKRREVELNDAKPGQGLGEVYAEQYARAAAGGTSEDKDEKTRAAARLLFKELCVKLDALTHFHFAPKPVIEDMAVRSDVPAIVMEEAAPVAVSKASLQLPSEVFAPEDGGRPVAQGELSREERKRARARRKRVDKAEKKAAGGHQPMSPDAAVAAAAAAGDVKIIGRKSAATEAEQQRKGGNKGVGKQQFGGGGSGGATVRHAGKSDFGKSTAVFARLQEQQAQAAAGGGVKVVKTTGAGDKATADARRMKL